MSTKISWCDTTWSPVVGCTKCSPGCANCYAERMAYRLACMGQRKYDKVLSDYDWRRWNGSVYCDESALDKPLHWRNPRRIFVCSMSDLFHPKVPFEFIDKVVGVFKRCPQHIGIILTKRADVMLTYAQSCRKCSWPENIIGMVTAENQAMADLRIPLLLQCGFKTTGVSIEPMLEGVDIREVLYRGRWYKNESPPPRPDWVVTGAESKGGHAGRECKLEWVRDVVSQCDAAGVGVHVKQLHIDGKLVKNIKEFPPDLRRQEKPNGH